MRQAGVAAVVPFAFGSLRIAAEGDVLTAIGYVEGPPGKAPRDPLLREAARQIRAYGRGGLRRFDLPLAPAASPFQAALRAAIQAIPWGEVASYGGLARQIGSAPRAVGQGCGRNTLMLVVPCHRVLAAGGAIGGYGTVGGLELKRRLLAHEGYTPLSGVTSPAARRYRPDPNTNRSQGSAPMPDFGVHVTAADGGRFGAYLARPAGGSGPGLLVIQEIFGVNRVMRDLCDAYAAKGYAALCPDLFWRQEPGIDITDKTDAEMQKAFSLFQGFNVTAGVEDLIASLAALRALPECTGRAGTIGFCLGGKLAYLMATRSDADCSVGYYGVGIEQALDEASAITKPLLLHIAEKDGYCPPEAQAEIKAKLGRVPAVTIHSYPGMEHAFARPGGGHYDAAAADLANRRTAEFLATHLS